MDLRLINTNQNLTTVHWFVYEHISGRLTLATAGHQNSKDATSSTSTKENYCM